MSAQQNHYAWPDIAKGVGIILVIMGYTMLPLHVAIDVYLSKVSGYANLIK